MKKVYLLPLLALTLLMFSCGGDTEKVTEEVTKEIDVVEEEIAEEVVEEVKEEITTLTNVGIGPITELKLDGDIDEAIAKKGEDLYSSKGCTACHNPTMTIIGPAPEGIFGRRNPAWVMNMILNPTEMLQKDPTAMSLLKEYNNIMMLNQNLTENETRAIAEYFRSL